MNLKKNIYTKFLALMAICMVTLNSIQAQQFNLINKESSLTVLGTSSLHDWHVTAEQQTGKLVLKNLESAEIDKCTIEIVAESLKSGKSSMDKNTYKALNTTTHKTITFKLIEVKEIINKSKNTYTIKAEGDLTISGVKKRIPIEFSLSIVDNKITLIGEKNIKMTDFSIDPPKALLGTITTGDDITIKFSSVFKRTN